MSYADLIARMRAGGVVVIDGATGTELERRGAPMNDLAWCVLLRLTDRVAFEAVHQAYSAAGAEVITANTFAGSGLLLGQAG
ncbi:MAG: homocysteine S-methyltransferase family protein, partial [Pseudomonadota bacterium]|nr:homocysteine S-methyltransferase family protein [Pseudomonadota bacterium]